MGRKTSVNTDYDTTYGTNNFLLFTDDNSDYGPDAPTGTGNGDYRPAAGSPMIGRGVIASIDRYRDGATRAATHDSGAMVKA